MNPMESYMNSQNADMAGSADGQSPAGYGFTEDEMAGKKTGKLTFNKPSGFKMPDGVQDGEPFDAMATLKMENGKLVLHELDGAPVHDEDGSMEGDEEGKAENNDDESDESDGSDDDMTDESSDSGDEPESEDSADAAPDDQDSKPVMSEPSEDEGEDGVGADDDFLSAVEKKAEKKKKK